jgi:ribulose-phosphate 3-epimerase
MSYKLAPSILSADFGNLERDIQMLNKSQADWIHVDIMDGVFVPNISFGFPIMKMLQKTAEKELDVHLMIVEPERYIEDFANHGASTLCFHYEASTHLHRSIHQVKKHGMKAGIALNPHTPIHLLEDVIEETDMVLVMSVNPGFAAQSFIEHTYAKVERLKELILKRNAKTVIEVDGGVNLSNASQLIHAGADILVAGSAVFATENPEERIAAFKKLS